MPATGPVGNARRGTLATAAALFHVTRLTIRLGRALSAVTIVVAGIGGWQHADENYKTAPLG